ncbi:ankyrin repeat domain-containing protein [Ferrimonas pelagia]
MTQKPIILFATLLSILMTGCAHRNAATAGDADWYDAAQVGHSGYVEQHSGDLNTQSLEGQHPLFFAYSESDRLAFKALLEAGADPHTANTQGTTLLCQAAESNDPFYLRELLAYGANIDQANPGDPKRPNAAFCAAASGRKHNLTLLISLGADQSVRNSDGDTVWDVAEELLPTSTRPIKEQLKQPTP